MTCSRRDSPKDWTVSVPSTMGPVSKSTNSEKEFANLVLLEILITGLTGFPVGVPKPVEKRMRFAPEPAIAVVDSTSFPAVQSKLSPSLVTHPG